MNKIMIFAVSGNEERVFSDIQEYLQMKTDCVNISTEQIMKLSFAGLEVDFYYREVRIDKNVINFIDLEFRILLYLAKQPGRIFTYQQIYEGVWGEEYIYEKGIIMSHIRHIRQKLESGGGSSSYIENIRGVGYRFKKPMTDSS